MLINKMALAALLTLGCLSAAAQVLPPAEIADPAPRALQEKHYQELKDIGAAIGAHQFPFHFYLSRKLDLTEAQQPGNDRRAIQFDKYQGQLVLKITGNYYASYSADLMTENERARATYADVMLPILLEAIPRLKDSEQPRAFALEISHHVRKRVLGVTNERVENVVLVLPKAAAERLIVAKDEAGRHAAALEGTAFLNGNAILLFPEDEKQLAVERPPQPAPSRPNLMSSILKGPSFPVETGPERADTPQDVSAQALKNRDTTYREELEKMVKELAAQARFVAYAPPSFIAFRNGVYLQIPVTSTLNEAGGGSLYRMAALAFDRHIAHLIRPVMAHFNDSADFSGIDFSTSIRSGGKEEGSVEAVEYIFSLRDLRRYQNFDITGQELIHGGFILVNGERISLELQAAEGS